MLVALLLAAAPPAIERESVGDGLHRLKVEAADLTAQGGRAMLREAAESLCGERLPAYGSFALGEGAFEQELFCLPHHQAGDTRLAVLAGSYAWFAARDFGRYDEAWAVLSERMQAASPLSEWRAAAERFNAAAGPVRRRQVTRITVYEDPPDAPEPGLYVAADFSADFANLAFACGYLMWHRRADGAWRLVREEQNVVDRETAEDLSEIDRPRLREQMGCRD